MFLVCFQHDVVSVPMCVCLLTVEPDVMVGEDGGSVALGNSSHGDVEHAVGRLHVMLLIDTTDKQIDSNQPFRAAADTSMGAWRVNSCSYYFVN